jgi:valine--pyruvate aminotransferase
VLSMSLSKIGLPSLRTGILVAREEMVRAIGAMNAVMSPRERHRRPGADRRLFESGEILRISRDTRAGRSTGEGASTRSPGRTCPSATAFRTRSIAAEGSLFLWLWFPELPGTTAELYERLKASERDRRAGRYFCFGTARPVGSHRPVHPRQLRDGRRTSSTASRSSPKKSQNVERA